MGFTIDVDIGGTFTDGFLTRGERAERVKVDTTPHDLTVCFMNCLSEGASKFGLELREMLRDTEVLRFSTTVGTNTILQRNGPKLGLLVTRGFEGSLYSPDESEGLPECLQPFVLPSMVMGLGESTGPDGKVEEALDGEEVKPVMEHLLDSGARTIVVSLRNSHANHAHELEAKRVIETEYPRHYLGSVPLLCASDVSIRPNDYLRTNAAVLSAYIRRDMVRNLYKAEEDVRRAGYGRPLLVVHSAGGAARVAKTTAMDTYNSGPVAGLLGCITLARELYGIQDFVSVDVGGTSADIGVVKAGVPPLEREPLVDVVPINIPMIRLGTASGAGGSIVHVERASGRLLVGPDSAGALPGPVAFDLGGTEPTVTDADLVLGRLNPDYFLGGRRKLNREKAARALKSRVADRLGISVEEAAFRVLRVAEEETSREMEREVARHGLQARDLTLIAFGGAGGARCCGYAANLGIRRVLVFAFNAVASAMGASTMDVVHSYESLVNLTLRSASGAYPRSYQRFDEVVRDLREAAVRDMRGEGFSPDSISYLLELELRGPAGSHVVESPYLGLEAEEQARDLCARYAQKSGIGDMGGELVVEIIGLKATCATPHYKFPTFEDRGEDPSKALKGVREVYWDGRFVPTSVYERDLLECGNRVEGPAIVEATDTTFVVPPGWSYTADRYLNALLEATKP